MSFAFLRLHRTWSFHLVVFEQRTAKKCTKIYNARAQPLFCSLNLLFGDVLVAVVATVCLSSLMFQVNKYLTGFQINFKRLINSRII